MPTLTLFSDFGFEDASVAITRGILLQYFPDWAIVDISHSAPPFDRVQAAYLLRAALPHFPGKTYHLVLFDLYAVQLKQAVVLQQDSQFLIGAHASIFPQELNGLRAYEMGNEELSFAAWLHGVAQLIQQLDKDQAFFSNLPLLPADKKQEALPKGPPKELVCNVLHVDAFENVVLDVTRRQFEEARNGRSFVIRFSRLEEITELHNQYSDVRPGYRLCRFNSAGHLEIAVNRGNAASLFGLRAGSQNNSIKIIFE